MNLGKYNILKEDWTIVEFFNSLKTEDKNIVKLLEIIDKEEGFEDNEEEWGQFLFEEHNREEFKELLNKVINSGVVRDITLEKVINTIEENIPDRILERNIGWSEEVREWRNMPGDIRNKSYLEFLEFLVDDRLIYILHLDGGEDELDTMLARLYPIIVEEQRELIRELQKSGTNKTNLFS